MLNYIRIKNSVRYFPKGDFPSDNFQSDNFPKVRLGLRRRCRLKGGPSAVARKGLRTECCGQNIPGDRALRLGWTRGSSAATRTDLGTSCRLVNGTLGKIPLGKIPLGSCRFEKSLWEST